MSPVPSAFESARSTPTPAFATPTGSPRRVASPPPPLAQRVSAVAFQSFRERATATSRVLSGKFDSRDHTMTLKIERKAITGHTSDGKPIYGEAKVETRAYALTSLQINDNGEERELVGCISEGTQETIQKLVEQIIKSLQGLESAEPFVSKAGAENSLGSLRSVEYFREENTDPLKEDLFGLRVCNEFVQKAAQSIDAFTPAGHHVEYFAKDIKDPSVVKSILCAANYENLIQASDKTDDVFHAFSGKSLATQKNKALMKEAKDYLYFGKGGDRIALLDQLIAQYPAVARAYEDVLPAYRRGEHTHKELLDEMRLLERRRSELDAEITRLRDSADDNGNFLFPKGDEGVYATDKDITIANVEWLIDQINSDADVTGAKFIQMQNKLLRHPGVEELIELETREKPTLLADKVNIQDRIHAVKRELAYLDITFIRPSKMFEDLLVLDRMYESVMRAPGNGEISEAISYEWYKVLGKYDLLEAVAQGGYDALCNKLRISETHTQEGSQRAGRATQLFDRAKRGALSTPPRRRARRSASPQVVDRPPRRASSFRAVHSAPVSPSHSGASSPALSPVPLRSPSDSDSPTAASRRGFEAVGREPPVRLLSETPPAEHTTFSALHNVESAGSPLRVSGAATPQRHVPPVEDARDLGSPKVAVPMETSELLTQAARKLSKHSLSGETSPSLAGRARPLASPRAHVDTVHTTFSEFITDAERDEEARLAAKAEEEVKELTERARSTPTEVGSVPPTPELPRSRSVSPEVDLSKLSSMSTKKLVALRRKTEQSAMRAKARLDARFAELHGAT